MNIQSMTSGRINTMYTLFSFIAIALKSSELWID